MSYRSTNTLQSEIFRIVSNDPVVGEQIGDAIFDVVPIGEELPENYIRIGHESFQQAASQTHSGMKGHFIVSIFSKSEGFKVPKKIATQLAHIITKEAIDLSPSTLVNLYFSRSRSYQLRGGDLRQIKMWFNVIIDTSES